MGAWEFAICCNDASTTTPFTRPYIFLQIPFSYVWDSLHSIRIDRMHAK